MTMMQQNMVNRLFVVCEQTRKTGAECTVRSAHQQLYKKRQVLYKYRCL